jgi:hypothetical protein
MRIVVRLVSTLICTRSTIRIGYPNFYDLGCNSGHIASAILRDEDFRKIDRSPDPYVRRSRLRRCNGLM